MTHDSTPPNWNPQPPAWGGAPAWGLPEAPKPGTIPLRPLTAGDFFSGTFATVGRYWKQVYGFCSLVMLLALVVVGGLVGGALWANWDTVRTLDETADGASPDVDALGGLLVTGGAVLLVAMLLWLCAVATLQAGFGVVTSHAVVGKPLTVGGLWREARSRVPSLAGVQLLTALVLVVPVLVAYGSLIGLFVGLFGMADAPVSGSGPSVTQTGGQVIFLLSLLLLPTALAIAAFLYVRLSLAPAVAVLERCGPGTALSRSWRLVGGSWWRVFGLTLLIGISVAAVNQVLQIPVSLVSVLTGGVQGWQDAASGSGGSGELSLASLTAIMTVTVVGSLLASIVTVPFSHIWTNLVYVDRRIRREGLDLALAQAAGLPPHRPAT